MERGGSAPKPTITVALHAARCDRCHGGEAARGLIDLKLNLMTDAHSALRLARPRPTQLAACADLGGSILEAA